MAAEAIEGTMQDLSDGTEGQKGYVIGRIVFEVGSMLIPASKIGQLGKITKVQVLDRLLSKGSLLKGAGRARAIETKAVCVGGCFVAGVPVRTMEGNRPIEQIQKGDVVWSQNEFDPAQAGWRTVSEVHVTHPRKIWHLSYAFQSGGRTQTDSPIVETVGVTEEHPFWVERTSFAGFVPAGALRVGDRLRCAGGETAMVRSMVLEEAPAEAFFTTYNFSVAEHHTYFVGNAGLWVHNTYPHLTSRENIRSAMHHLIRPDRIENLGKERFRRMEEAKRVMEKNGDVLPHGAWASEARDCCEYMFRQAAADHIPLADVPSVRQLNNFFARMPGNGKGFSNIHHSIEEWIQNKLGMTGDPHSVPGWVMHADEHLPRHDPNSLSGALAAAIKPLPSGINNPAAQLVIARELKKVYQAHGLDDLWEVTRKTLAARGYPVP